MTSAGSLRSCAAVLGLFWLALMPLTAEAQINATLVDRGGNRYQIRQLVCEGGSEIELWVDGQRRLISLDEIDGLRLGGGPSDEVLPITVNLRTGRQLQGTVLAGGRSVMPGQGGTGGGHLGQRFGGSTELGPFLIGIGKVSELLLEHAGPAAPEVILKATVVTAQGERFEIDDLRYRGTVMFEYSQGRKRRSKEMSRMARIEFGDTAAHEEIRSVTITFRSGKVTQGTVDAGTVRLPGETDRIYAERVRRAFSGSTAQGGIGLGLHDVKLILFPEPEGAKADSASTQP